MNLAEFAVPITGHGSGPCADGTMMPSAARESHPWRSAMSLAACALILLPVLAADAGAAQPGPEVISPLGAKFYPKPDETNAVAEAEKKLAADPTNVEMLIALGRAHVKVLRFREAIGTFTRAIALAPDNA